MTLRFSVEGRPAPQGSKRYLGNRGGKPVAVEMSKHVAPWRADVRAAAQTALNGEASVYWEAPLWVSLIFRMPRPKSHYRTGKNAHLLRDAAPRWPTGPPDVDKLVRSTLDAVTGVIFADDKTIVHVRASKRYADRPGCDIEVTVL